MLVYDLYQRDNGKNYIDVPENVQQRTIEFGEENRILSYVFLVIGLRFAERTKKKQKKNMKKMKKMKNEFLFLIRVASTTEPTTNKSNTTYLNSEYDVSCVRVHVSLFV